MVIKQSIFRSVDFKPLALVQNLFKCCIKSEFSSNVLKPPLGYSQTSQRSQLSNHQYLKVSVLKQILTTRPPTPREETYHVCTVQGGAQVTAKCSHLHTEIFLSSTDQNRRHHPLTTRQSEIIKIFFSHLAPAVSCYKVLNEYIILSIPVRGEEEDTQKKADLKSPSGEVNLDLCTVEDDHRAHTV